MGTQSVAVIDGEKYEEITEDEQRGSAEMTEPVEHEKYASDSSTNTIDSKMVEESQLICDRKETEAMDDKIGESIDPPVSSVCREENEDRTTTTPTEPIESTNDSGKALDTQPEYVEQMPNIVDEVEKIAAETSTITPEIVPAQSEFAQDLEKQIMHQSDNKEKILAMPCNEEVIAESVALVEGDQIEKIAEEISAEKLKSKEESDGEKSVPAVGNEIAKIAEESATILTTDIDPTLSETSEISEEKTGNNEESSSIIQSVIADEAHTFVKIAAESATATTLDIVPTQSGQTELSEEKPDSTEESSLIMPLLTEGEGKIENVAEDSAAMEFDIVSTQSEHAEILEDKPDFNEESSSIMQSIAAERAKIEHISEESAVIMTPDSVPTKNNSADNQVVNVQDTFSEEKRLLEENQKLREMLEKLFEAGKEQLEVISTLNRRVKNLEKKVTSSRKKKPRVKRNKTSKSTTYFTGNNNTVTSAA